MAGRASKAKGSAGERELCAYLAARGFPAHRNDQMFIGGKGNPDIDAQGLEGYHFEVKRVERLNVSEAMKQAAGDACGRIPAVVHRKNREPWLITMRLEDWLPERRNALVDQSRDKAAKDCTSSGGDRIQT